MSMPVLILEPNSYSCGANQTSAGAAPNATWFNSYHSIADHGQYLKDLAAAYPNNAETFSAGKSVEGRDLTGIHIWGSGGKGSKKGVVWHGTVHAREWITTMVSRAII
jgi:carboxypeptidase A4